MLENLENLIKQLEKEKISLKINLIQINYLQINLSKYSKSVRRI